MADAPDMAGAPKTVVVLRRLAHAAAVGLMTGAVILTLARTTCSYASRFTSQGGATPSEQVTRARAPAKLTRRQLLLSTPWIVGATVAEKGALHLLQDPQKFPLAAEMGGLSNKIGWIASKLMVPSAVSQQLDTILLHGPSGTGKTTMIQAAVKLCEADMLSVTNANVHSHVVGGSERKIQAVFDLAFKLSQHGRCCIVFDHFDTLFPGNGAIGDFLGPDLIKVWDAVEAAQPAQAPGLHQLSQRPKPLIIAVTHRLELVPLAVRNRFTESVSVAMPSATAREEILCKRIQKLQRDHSSTGSFSFHPELLLNVTLVAHDQAERRPVQQIANWTTGFTADRLHQLIQEAIRLAVEQACNGKIRVHMAHFAEAKRLYWC